MSDNQAPTDAPAQGGNWWEAAPLADPEPQGGGWGQLPPGFVLDQPAPSTRPTPTSPPLKPWEMDWSGGGDTARQQPAQSGNWWDRYERADQLAPLAQAQGFGGWAANNSIYLICFVLLFGLVAIFSRRNSRSDSGISTGFRRVGIVLAAIPAFAAIFPVMISAAGNMSYREAALFVAILLALSIILYALSRAIGWIVLGFRHE